MWQNEGIVVAEALPERIRVREAAQVGQHPSPGGCTGETALETAFKEEPGWMNRDGADRLGGCLRQGELQGQSQRDGKVPGLSGEEQRAWRGWKMFRQVL